jgi:hypothetical protein
MGSNDGAFGSKPPRLGDASPRGSCEYKIPEKVRKRAFISFEYKIKGLKRGRRDRNTFERRAFESECKIGEK